MLIFVSPEKQTTPAFVTLFNMVVVAIPSLFGMFYAKQARDDIRNGVVQNKAREGAKEALREVVPDVAIPASELIERHNRRSTDYG